MAVLFFDAKCVLCRMCREWVELAVPDLTFADSNDEPRAAAMGVRDTRQLRDRMCLLSDGREYWGFDAVARLAELARGSRGLGRVLSLAPVRQIGSRLYDLVAHSRGCATAPSPRSSP